MVKTREKLAIGIWGWIIAAWMMPAASMGSAKPSNPGTCEPGPPNQAITTPRPVRQVFVRQLGTKIFQLPNGSHVDINADLQSILLTAVTSASAFSPIETSQIGPCDSYLEIRSTVTNFQMDVAEVGVSFGFNPSGSLVPGLTIGGKANVKVGTIAMDFSVWQCVSGSCSAVAAMSSNHLTSGINLSLEVDFSQITTGASLIYNTPLGDMMRKIMMDGMTKLNASNRLNELMWYAIVRDYNNASGTLIFDAGRQARISSNQAFEVYAPTDATQTGVCHVYETVAYVHTVSADTVSSVAMIDQMKSSRGIKVGDVVMIRTVNP